MPVFEPSFLCRRRTLGRSLVGALLIGLVAVVLLPSSASAATCWRRVLADWSDGHIDHVYPLECYRAALKHLPEDLRTYSSAPADIHRALMATALGHRPRSRTSAAPAPRSGQDAQASAFPYSGAIAAGLGTILVALGGASALRHFRAHRRS